MKFDAEKALEMITYASKKLGGKSSKFFICKTFYLADKEHLDKYGRFLCDDRYIAMQYGPVPSGVFDIIKASFVKSDETATIREAIRGAGDDDIVPIREPNLDLLSKSEQDCLDSAILVCLKETFGGVKLLTHSDPAWKNAMAIAKDAMKSSAPMSVEDLISQTTTPADLKEYWLSTHTI